MHEANTCDRATEDLSGVRVQAIRHGPRVVAACRNCKEIRELILETIGAFFLHGRLDYDQDPVNDHDSHGVC